MPAGIYIYKKKQILQHIFQVALMMRNALAFIIRRFCQSNLTMTHTIYAVEMICSRELVRNWNAISESDNDNQLTRRIFQKYGIEPRIHTCMFSFICVSIHMEMFALSFLQMEFIGTEIGQTTTIMANSIY